MFINAPYFQRIEEDRAVGSNVLTVTATDQDLIGAIVYEVVLPGSPYFIVDPAFGVVSLASSVKLDSNLQYRVCLGCGIKHIYYLCSSDSYMNLEYSTAIL